jgi:hypothetical protein
MGWDVDVNVKGKGKGKGKRKGITIDQEEMNHVLM